jgi:hypothetical protein
VSAAPNTRLNQRVNLGVHVLHARVRQHDRALVERVAFRVASISTATLLTGANVSPTRQVQNVPTDSSAVPAVVPPQQRFAPCSEFLRNEHAMGGRDADDTEEPDVRTSDRRLAGAVLTRSRPNFERKDEAAQP